MADDELPPERCVTRVQIDLTQEPDGTWLGKMTIGTLDGGEKKLSKLFENSNQAMKGTAALLEGFSLLPRYRPAEPIAEPKPS
jgi:hypothetical protein